MMDLEVRDRIHAMRVVTQVQTCLQIIDRLLCQTGQHTVELEHLLKDEPADGGLRRDLKALDERTAHCHLALREAETSAYRVMQVIHEGKE